MTTQSAHPPPGTWNARNLLTVLEVAESARVHLKTAYSWVVLIAGVLSELMACASADAVGATDARVNPLREFAY
jgi:hypothetical protein